jgi:hypothetical protein
VNPPVTSSEALLIEALAEMSGVLDRAEALIPALDMGQRGMVEANTKLVAQLAAIEVRMAAFAETAKIHAAKHIAERTDEAAKRAINLQLRAMQEAARMLFQKELGPALQALVQPLQRVQEVARQSARPWDAWLTHATTAGIASLWTWLATSGVWRP